MNNITGGGEGVQRRQVSEGHASQQPQKVAAASTNRTRPG